MYFRLSDNIESRNGLQPCHIHTEYRSCIKIWKLAAECWTSSLCSEARSRRPSVVQQAVSSWYPDILTSSVRTHHHIILMLARDIIRPFCLTCILHVYEGIYNKTILERIIDKTDLLLPVFNEIVGIRWNPKIGVELSKANNNVKNSSKKIAVS